VLHDWYRLWQALFKLWQLFALGVTWIAGGIAVQVIPRYHDRYTLALALLLYGSGALHFWIARKALKEQHALDGMRDIVEQPEARLARVGWSPAIPTTTRRS
jgi:hypothetical protein